MITAKELLANGWNWYPKVSNGKISHVWEHPKITAWGCVPDPVTNEYSKELAKHTLAQARWAHEHILEKGK